MKTKHLIRFSLVTASVCLMIACKKDNTSADKTPPTSNLQTSTDDQTMASNENDAVSNDVSAGLTANSAYFRVFANRNASAQNLRVDGESPICDATLSFDTSGVDNSMIITYNGSNCWGNRTRTGTITISEPKGSQWSEEGTTVTVSIKNLTITRVIDGKSIVINGKKTITNSSGGLLIDLANHGPITHEIHDSLSIACDKGAVHTWYVSKHRLFEYDNGIKLTTTGTHSDGSHSDIAEWGTDRFGVSYTSRITVPKVITQFCSFRLIKGQDTFTKGDNFSAVLTYGLDATGKPVTSCPSGSFYAQATWTYIPTGTTGSFLFPY